MARCHHERLLCEVAIFSGRQTFFWIKIPWPTVEAVDDSWSPDPEHFQAKKANLSGQEEISGLTPHSPYGALIVPSYITLTHYNYSRYNL